MLAQLLAEFGGPLLIGLLSILGAAGAYFGIKRSGEKKAETQAELDNVRAELAAKDRALDNVQRTNDAQNDVAGLDPDGRRDRLREYAAENRVRK